MLFNTYTKLMARISEDLVGDAITTLRTAVTSNNLFTLIYWGKLANRQGLVRGEVKLRSNYLCLWRSFPLRKPFSQ